jgi:hypothetical protein
VRSPEDALPAVTEPKGSIGDDPFMTDPRPHIRRRADALDRHRSITTTAAIAGVAGTAAFSLMAAMTWSGEPAATPLPAAANDDDGGAAILGPTSTPRARSQSEANRGFAQPPTVSTPRPGRNSGGHATSGGSH